MGGSNGTSSSDLQARNDIPWIAHELRSPLVGARTALELVLSLDDPIPFRDVLDAARKQLQALTEYIEPTLYWCMGKIRLDLGDVEIGAVIREAALRASQHLDGDFKGVRFSDNGHAWVLGDLDQLSNALSRLIRSSIMHAPPGTFVDVSLEHSPDQVELRLIDSGDGGFPDPRNSDYDRHLARDSASNGRAGLGMLLAQRVVEAHGGSVQLVTTHGKTSVNVVLPAIAEPAE